LPKNVLERLEAEIKNLPPEKLAVERRQRVEMWIDAGHGSCVLRETEIARMAQNSLITFDGQRYRLMAWVIMPNHVHVLFQPLNGWTMAKIVASWKKYTARKIFDYRRANPVYTPGNADLPIGETNVWHREYWDRFMRDERHFQQTVEYIHQNPVKAGLVATAGSWPWSSAGQSAGNADPGGADPGNADPGNADLGNADLLIGDVENAQNANQEIGDPRGVP
jgi:REP element-mobilizing transposase RayT